MKVLKVTILILWEVITMTKLLSANFSRLMRDKMFWIVSAAMFIISAFMIIKNGMTAADMDDVNNIKSLNSCYFNMLPMLSFFYSVFISFFIGTDYSDGTIRNKIVIGHSRTNIYLSNFITCFAGTLIIFAALLIGGAFGVPYFGYWQGGIKDYIIVVFLGILITAALTAVLTLISMLSTNKAITVVLTIVVSLILTLAASSIYNILCEPEFTRDFVSISADGNIEFGPEVKNPAYVSGMQRKIYEFLLQFLPAGQSILIANEELTIPLVNAVYSVLLTVAVNICGVFIFKKKDLK